jgi:AraC family transcriptional regulator
MHRIPFTLACAALCGAIASPAAAAPQPTETVSVATLEAQHVLVLPMRGSYAQHDAAFARLVAQLRALAAGPVGPPFGRYLNDPQQVAESDLLWEVGFPVGPGVEAPAPFEVRDLPGGQTAVLVHEGPYETSGAAWPVLLSWVSTHGYRPTGAAMQIFLGNARATGPEGPRTELRLPVAPVAP